MTVMQESCDNIDYESIIELTTVDNIIIQLQTKDLNFFFKYPESTLWLIYKNDGLDEFKKFVKKYLTKKLFDAIIYFYNYDKWPHPISIVNIFDSYNFLNLPTYLDTHDNDSSDDDSGDSGDSGDDSSVDNGDDDNLSDGM